MILGLGVASGKGASIPNTPTINCVQLLILLLQPACFSHHMEPLGLITSDVRLQHEGVVENIITRHSLD